ncbi:MAG: hypothetical protein V3U02_06640 [Calditrichia bacterium]
MSLGESILKVLLRWESIAIYAFVGMYRMSGGNVEASVFLGGMTGIFAYITTKK